jgi:hypothetical protein
MWAGSRFEFRAAGARGRRGDPRPRRIDVDVSVKKAARARWSSSRCATSCAATAQRAGDHRVHDIVYRDNPQPGDPRRRRQPAPTDAQWQREIVPDDVLLFRYSALTFNGHRIHYDRRYVTEVEGYPGLIVHGPLIATLLLDLLRREAAGGPHRRRPRARDRRAVLHAPARRPRRAHHQDRASRRRRLRARLRPARARQSSHFVWTNRSKESLSLDLKHPRRPGDPAAPAARIGRRAGAEPGARRAAQRMGLSYDGSCRAQAAPHRLRHLRLRRRRRPRPYRDKKAYDLLIQSESGFVSVTGTPDEAPQGRLLDRRHRGRHVRLQQHPRGAAAARADRPRPPHRRLDAGSA